MKKVKSLLKKVKTFAERIKASLLKPVPVRVNKGQKFFLIAILLISISQKSLAQAPFITTWKTSAPNESITFNTTGAFTYSFTVDWGDGTEDNTIYTSPGDVTHTYADADTYTVAISGQFPSMTWTTNNTSRDRLMTIEQWGDNEWRAIRFRDCINLTYNATDTPDLSQMTSTAGMFNGCTSFNGDISNWDMSTILTTGSMFAGASSFNQDLDEWDVSNVTSMQYMFNEATSFNGNISSWDVSNVTQMQHMFNGASSFNQNINGWDVGEVTNMLSMFLYANSFNQPLDNWDVSSVTNMSTMFFGTVLFNQNIGGWDVGSATNMSSMFASSASFNQDISGWDVSNTTSMASMFFNNPVFDQDISSWDVGNVLNMSGIFYLSIFNQDIASWDVSNVTNMSSMFRGNSAFNQDIGNWDVSNVTNMSSMFHDASLFNQNLSNWNVGNVTNMERTFLNASEFDQSLDKWDVSNVTTMNAMLSSSNLSTKNYDKTLESWSSLSSLQSNVPLGASSLNYCHSGAARNTLATNHGWIFSGDLEVCNAFITTWETTQANETITIPTTGGGYNYTVNWGDGGLGLDNPVVYTGNAGHSYATPGTYTIEITGDFPRIYFNNSGDKENIQSIDQWGDILWESMEGAFLGCTYLTYNATDDPNLSNATSLYGMFNDAGTFDGDLSSWDVSSITSIGEIFRGAGSFNGDITTWDVSKVERFNSAFDGAMLFNQDLSNWNVGSATHLNNMFRNARNFNSDISSWDVSSAVHMVGMFSNAFDFDQDIGNWDVSNVISFNNLFNGASAFSHDLGAWDVSNVTSMLFAFSGTTLFNSDISAWNVSNITTATGMFLNSGFNQNLGGWDITNITDMASMFNGSALSVANYDATLSGWAKQASVPSNISLGSQGLFYCAAETPRNALISTYGWTITGDELTSCSEIALLDPQQNPIANGQAEAIDFGNVEAGENLDIQFTIQNNGEGILSITEIAVEGESFSLLQDVTSIAANQEAQLIIRMNNNTAGVYSGTITLSSNDKNNPNFQFSISGEVNASLVSLIEVTDPDQNTINNNQGEPVDFGEVKQGENLDQTFTIQNSGEATLDLSSINVVGDNFSLLTEDVDSIEPNETQSFTIRLSSSSAGAFDAKVTIQSDASNDPVFDFSIQGEVTEAEVLGITNSFDVSIFPNPTTDFLSISFPDDASITDKSISVHTLLGDELLKVEVNSTSSPTIISLQDLSTGMFLIMVKSGANTATHRVIKK